MRLRGWTLGLIFIVLVVVRATLLSIVSTSLMYAIAISVVYHSAAFAYGRFTGQALVLQPYVKQLGQRALSPDFDVDFAYVEDAMAAAPAVTFQTTINKLAGALEGRLAQLHALSSDVAPLRPEQRAWRAEKEVKFGSRLPAACSCHAKSCIRGVRASRRAKTQREVA